MQARYLLLVEACIFGKASLVFRQTIFWNQMEILYQTESFLTACISLVHEPDKPWSRQWWSFTNTRKELRRCARRLGTITQSIFCAQSGTGIRLNFWKWSGESWYPGALPPLLENFRRTFSPDPTDCPWVSEDGKIAEISLVSRVRTRRNNG